MTEKWLNYYQVFSSHKNHDYWLLFATTELAAEVSAMER
jgi:hypothetical protein